MSRKSTTTPTAPESRDALPRIAVTLTDESAYLTKFDAAGRPLSTYPVSAIELGQCFRGLPTAETITSGILPANTLTWGHSPKGQFIAVWLPPARRAITFAHGKRKLRLHIPLPGFVFAGRGGSYWIVAASVEPRPGVYLFHTPLSNVYEDGLICTGDVDFPKCTPDTITEAAQLFFESEFNDHLSNERVKSPLPLLKFLQSIQSKRKFPLSALKSMECRLEDWLKEL